MKTIVIQASIENSSSFSSYWGTDEVTSICNKSVENWAKVNSFDYKHYKEPVHPPSTLATKERLPTYNKLFLLDQPDYDRIVWMDNDVLIEGNPVIDDSNFCVYEYPTEYKDCFNLWINSGIMWGTRSVMKDLYNYVMAQEDKNTRDNYLEYQRMAVILKDDITFPGAKHLNYISDEVVIQQWLKNKTFNYNRLRNCVILGQDPLPIDYNFFVHFEGEFKRFQYEMYKLLRSSRNNNYLNTMMQNMLLYSKFLNEAPKLDPHEKRIK